MRELTPYEKDLLLLGMLSTSINNSELTARVKKKNDTRQLSRIRFFYYGRHRLCRDAFIYLVEISREKLTNLKKHFTQHGLIPKRKKSGKFIFVPTDKKMSE